ncbi:hypothetical protein [Romboutsia sp.]|uniref:hypothetical protein n=1 Tax=Romboutsia sp. TaxID=1965302 RepID=UPI003F30719A
MRRRYDQITEVSKALAEDAFKSYTGKKDYRRAIEIYTMLATFTCIPQDISNFSKNMLAKLNKKIDENT